jgi:hypothetical protein
MEIKHNGKIIDVTAYLNDVSTDKYNCNCGKCRHRDICRNNSYNKDGARPAPSDKLDKEKYIGIIDS